MSSNDPSAPPIPWASRPEISELSNNIAWKNAVYYPSWRVYRGDSPATMNYSCISHVFYAFAHLEPSGVVLLKDEWADAQMIVDEAPGCIGSFLRLKSKHSHLKLVLSIGGGAGSQNFAAVAATAATRDTFARSARKLVDASGFDGIDIDWEHPSGQEEGRDFLSLLAAIRLYLPDENYHLSAALPAGEWALRNIDVYKAQDYLDLINIMAYDFAGSWSSKSGHHAQLYPDNPHESSGSTAVEYLINRGFPPAKILLGVPVYGRSFLGATGPGQNFTGNGGDEGTFEYKSLPREGANEQTDTRLVAAYGIGGDGGFVSYDTPETVKIKGAYCREKRLGGLFYWTGTADISSGPRSLIAAGFHALHVCRSDIIGKGKEADPSI